MRIFGRFFHELIPNSRRNLIAVNPSVVKRTFLGLIALPEFIFCAMMTIVKTFSKLDSRDSQSLVGVNERIDRSFSNHSVSFKSCKTARCKKTLLLSATIYQQLETLSTVKRRS